MEEEKSSSKSDALVTRQGGTTGDSPEGKRKLSINMTRRIGIGGFSNVYLGTVSVDNSESTNQVAIKQIVKNIPNASVSYQRELDSLTALSNSPYTVKLFGFVECENYFSLLLGYSKHGDLCDFIMKRGKLNDETARTLLLQLIAGVSFIHSKGMCHCDLKPDNVFLDECNIKIGDFGLARPVQRVKIEDEKLAGSGYNIAPEMYKCLIYNESSDMWGLGCILFIMLTGAPPVIEATKKDTFFTALCKCIYDSDDFYEMHGIDQFSWDKKKLLNGFLNVQAMNRLTISAVLGESWMRGPTFSYQQIVQSFDQLE